MMFGQTGAPLPDECPSASGSPRRQQASQPMTKVGCGVKRDLDPNRDRLVIDYVDQHGGRLQVDYCSPRKGGSTSPAGRKGRSSCLVLAASS